MSYGTNSPFGMRPVQNAIGNATQGALNTYLIAANTVVAGGVNVVTTYDRNIFSGDPVYFNRRLQNNAGVPVTYTTGGVIGTVDDKAGNSYPIGVFKSCEYFDANNNKVTSDYWPANTQIRPNSFIKAFVYDDPFAIFEVQVSASADQATAQLTQFMIGQNALIAIGGGGANLPGGVNPAGGNVFTKTSAYYLDINNVTAAVSTATTQVKILGYGLNVLDNIYKPDGVTVQDFLVARVQFNGHYKGSVATIGTTAA